MGVKSLTFRNLADKFINSTFADQAKTLIMRTADAVAYGSAQTYTSETGTGIELTISTTEYNNPLILSGDIRIFTNKSQWTTIPRNDLTDINYNGVAYSIILAESDAADAAYFITARRK